MVHELKIAPIYFEAVTSSKKAFEVRKDDRNYQENDVLILKEYDNNAYTGREYAVIVTYILRGESCKDGDCIMSIKHDNYRNTLAILKALGYETVSYESERHICIFFYKSSEQSKIIYTANCEKECRHCYDVYFGHLEQVWEYDDEPDNGERKVSDYSYTAISQYTKDEVVQALNEVNKNINLEYEYEDTRIYFDNIEEIIKFHTEKYNCTKIK